MLSIGHLCHRNLCLTPDAYRIPQGCVVINASSANNSSTQDWRRRTRVVARLEVVSAMNATLFLDDVMSARYNEGRGQRSCNDALQPNRIYYEVVTTSPKAFCRCRDHRSAIWRVAAIDRSRVFCSYTHTIQLDRLYSPPGRRIACFFWLTMNDTGLNSFGHECLPTSSLEVEADGDRLVPRPFAFYQPKDLYIVGWCFSAVVSITTTRDLLSHHFHYPYHLLLLHITGALILRATLNWFLQPSHSHNNELDTSRGDIPRDGCHHTSLASQSDSLRTWLLYSGAVSGALIFIYQAILHTPNFLSLLMVASLEWQPPFLYTGMQDSKTVIKHLVFTSGLSLLWLSDFRLVPLGMVMTLLSTGCAGLTVISQYVHVIGEDTILMSSPLVLQPTARAKDFRISPTLSALMVAGFSTALLIIWYENPMIVDYRRCFTSVPEICIGFLASAFALEGGCFVVRPLKPFCNSQLNQLSSFERLAMALALTGLSAIFSSFDGVLPHISIWQFVGFFMAALAMLETNLLDTQSILGKRSRNLRSGQMCTSHLQTHSRDDRSLFNRITTFSGMPVTSPISFFLLLLGIISWFGLFYHAKTVAEPLLTIQEPNLDQSYLPNAAFDIVISHYEEPIDGVADQLKVISDVPRLQMSKPRVFVYAKSPQQNTSYISNALKERLPHLRISVERLTNVGREAEAYLHHMVEHWEDLAQHTLFIQAGMHHDHLSLRRINDYLTPTTGFLSIQTESTYCAKCSDCYDRYWSGDPTVLNGLYRIANHGADCRDIVLTYKGQFIASAARIRGNTANLYRILLDDLRNSSSAIHSPSYTDSPWHVGQPDSLNSPIFGYTLERMWGVLMQCSEMRVAHRCPSLLSGVFSKVKEANLADCQCLDT
nr:hypothetical protein CFP56_12335 [Quercus suber]